MAYGPPAGSGGASTPVDTPIPEPHNSVVLKVEPASQHGSPTLDDVDTWPAMPAVACDGEGAMVGPGGSEVAPTKLQRPGGDECAASPAQGVEGEAATPTPSEGTALLAESQVPTEVEGAASVVPARTQQQHLPTFPGGMWLEVFVPGTGETPPPEVIFPGPDGKFWRAWVPPGHRPGSSFKVQIVQDVILQPYSVVVPLGMTAGDAISYKGPDGMPYLVKVPLGVAGGQHFFMWSRTLLVPPPSKEEEISDEDLAPWLEAAKAFRMNADFEIADIASSPQLDFESLMTRMKVSSDGKVTIQALADKILLHRMVDNLFVPQMPVLLAVEDISRISEQIQEFVEERARCVEPCELFVKPAHLSSGIGVLCLPPPHVRQQGGGFKPATDVEREAAIKMLEAHVRRFMGERAAEVESLALRSLRPGFVVQPKYSSVVGFHYPLELRIVVLWGRARHGIWWWGHNRGNETIAAQRNVWFVRRQRVRGQLNSDDSWDVLHEHGGKNLGFDAALELFKESLPGIVTIAEHLGIVFGAPFLRTDFFVGSPSWGVRLNEVAYGSNIELRRPSAHDVARHVNDAPAVAKILQKGMACCEEHLPAEEFLAKIGVRGTCYEDIVVAPLPEPERMPKPAGALVAGPDPDCARHAVPPELCRTPREFVDSVAAQGGQATPSGARQELAEVVDAIFRNATPQALELRWKAPDGTLLPQCTFESEDEVEVQTAHGHVFVVVDPTSGDVLRRWQCYRDAGSRQEVEISFKVTVTFVNSMPADLNIFWEDTQTGALHQQGRVAGGAASGARILTFHGHRFVIKACDGEVVKTWQADASLGSLQVFTITAATTES
mmetsp:Transcript_81341/g.226505  ORF Transcript_81341/g.226505 Transcript_81341/m.226505 type:complete len:837 (+) Transcript_81341:80-2590(+)